MSTVDEGLAAFLNVIRESEVYREYRSELEQVKQVPGLKAQLDDYRKQNYEMQFSDGMDFARLEAFRLEFAEFRKDPLVDRFLAAELAFCRMMQDVNFKLTEGLDFE